MNVSNKNEKDSFTDTMGSIEINLNNNQCEPYIDRTLKNGKTNATTTAENSFYTYKNGRPNEESKLKRYKASTVRIIIAILLIVIILLVLANGILVVCLSNYF